MKNIQKNILTQLKIFKKNYISDGFNILALFGSYADGSFKKNSDIDILYDVEPLFIDKYKGFKAVSKVLEIQNELKLFFKKDIDLTSMSGLSDSIKQDISKKALYVQ
ncbi:MAG: nucleotidyltransferase domain-containing protein [Arcobacteraceae bacterium]|nr:nucleotidyltransferase domain-containing protein [Arcobacteraceae bacterium]